MAKTAKTMTDLDRRVLEGHIGYALRLWLEAIANGHYAEAEKLLQFRVVTKTALERSKEG